MSSGHLSLSFPKLDKAPTAGALLPVRVLSQIISFFRGSPTVGAMEPANLQKFFKEAATAQHSWLYQLENEASPDAAGQQRVKMAMELFDRYSKQAEEEAFLQAEARLRNYEGTPFANEHRTVIEAIYVAAAYSRLALAISLLQR